MLYGRTSVNRLSRFIEDIPARLLTKPRTPPAPAPEPPEYDDLPFAERPASRSAARSGFSAPGRGERPAFRGFTPPAPTKPAPAPVQYQPGDTVRHKSFGRGMILTVTRMGSDALLEIAFDEKGTKRLLANTASAHMEKL